MKILMVAMLILVACNTEESKPKMVQIRTAWCATESELKLFSACVGNAFTSQRLSNYAVRNITPACRRASCQERDVVCASGSEVYARANADELCGLK